MSETPRETLDQWLLSDGIGVAMLGAPIEVRQAIRVVLADRVVLANLAGRAQQRVLDLEAERDALRLACNVFAADLTEAGRLCGIADDEYPLRAVERVAAERDALREKLGEKGRVFSENLLMQGEEITRLRAEVGRLKTLTVSLANDVGYEYKERAEQAEEALRTLLDKMERIEASEAYRSVWIVAQIHSGPYHGENWAVERNAARAALRDTAPSEDRHWQNDADPNPGREQTAYQAGVEREKP